MWRVLLVIGAVLAVAVGCAPAHGGGGQGPPDDTPPPGQRWALRDGDVTAHEYRTAVSRFVSCVRIAGYTVSEPVLSPVDQLTLVQEIAFSGEPDAFNEAVQRCNVAHVSLVEPAFVESRRQVMDGALRDAVSECLSGRGFSPTGGEGNVTDFAASAGDRDVVVDCVTQQRGRLFPRLPGMVPVRICPDCPVRDE